jgi:hypothetical protein
MANKDKRTMKQKKTNVCEPIQRVNRGKGKMRAITEDLQQQNV